MPTVRMMTRNILCLAIPCWIAATGAVNAEAAHQAHLTSAAMASDSTEARDRRILSAPARLNVENVPLEAALREFQSVAGIAIAYSPTIVREARGVTCMCSDAGVGEALQTLLTGTGLEFAVLDGHLIIRRKQTPLTSRGLDISRGHGLADRNGPVYASGRAGAPMRPLQTGEISGRVFDVRSRQPLSAVQVYIPELDIGVLSREDGSFFLANVPVGTHTIRARRIGYADAAMEIVVNAGEVAVVTLEVAQQALALDEIVVTGAAGQARRREVGNTIAQIRTDKLVTPALNTDNLLAAQAPGVSVRMTGGQTGAGAAIRLRGNTSASLSNQPLIYIDGVRVSSEGLASQVPAGGRRVTPVHARSPLNDINPSDIERIEIVKGAAATTLYGAEAAAGVIQIFTKRGDPGSVQWTARIDQGIASLDKFGPAEEPYMKMDRWLRAAHNQRYSLSLSAGGDQMQYFVSGLVEDNQGVLPNDWQKKYSARGNFSFNASPTFRIRWNTSLSNDEIQNTPMQNTVFSLGLNAMRFPQSYVSTERIEDVDQVLDYEIKTYADRLTTGITLEYEPRPNWTNRLIVGYDLAASEMRQVLPYGTAMMPHGSLSTSSWRREIMSVDYVGNLQWRLSDDFRTTLSVGAQAVAEEDKSIGGYGERFAGPGDQVVDNAALNSSVETRQRVVGGGIFFQSMVDVKDRYFVTLGARVDGNSVFGENLGLQLFPKLSASYVLSEEGFFPDGFLGIEQLKLRLAWGHAGRAPGPFDALRTWDAARWEGQSAFLPLNVGNADLGPERTVEIEYGFDASFFHDRMTLGFTRYRQETSDALFPVQQIPSFGFTGSQLRNVGTVSNEGIEVVAAGTIIQRAALMWDIGVSVTTNKSEVLDLGGARRLSVGRGGYIDVGQPVPVVHGVNIQNGDEYAEPIFEDDYYFGPNHPTHTFVLSSTLTLPRNIRLSARGEYNGGHWFTDRASELGIERTTAWPICMQAYALIEQGRREELNARDRAWCDLDLVRLGLTRYPADFFRLRELGFSMPVTGLVPGVSDARLTASLNNWFSWVNKNFRAFDPEMSGNDGMHEVMNYSMESIPSPRTATVSVHVRF
jgi:TonB-dependent starch-binding outer membrane protein SusC